ncbi:NHLP bacteriocin export ABC transporter permease/ATPase subunit [Nisaea sp.]|uniref:NHLP bacteriocin export ABC transporter permease/ATPase subunit n=1 Tax=Nisaea sp. TaxID=2024842 RepID=UPI003B52AE55
MSSVQQHGETGETLRISGRDRLIIAPDHRVVEIEEGTANLFVQLVSEAGEPLGARRMVAALETGAMMPLPDTGFTGMRLVLVGVGAATLRLYSAEDRDALLDRTESMTHGFELGLGEFLIHTAPANRDAHSAYSIAPGETSELSGGGLVSSARAVWVAHEAAPAADAGEGEESETTQAIALVGHGRALQVPAGIPFAALGAGETVLRHGWSPVDRWITAAVVEVAQTLFEAAREREKRVARRIEDDEAQLGTALRRLPAIVNAEREDSAARIAGSGQPPVIAALQFVCAAQKIDFRPTADLIESGDPHVVLQDVLRRANLRFRKIVLTDKWWTREGADAVGFDAETGEPCAILRTGPGRFERVSADGGRRVRISASEAGRLDEEAFTVFKPLPFRPLKAMDLVRHVLSGRARFDMRWAAVMAILTALLGLVPPMLTGKLLNEVVPFAETESLVHLALGLAFLAIGSAMFQVVRSIALLRVEAFADGGLQAAVWDRLLRLPLTFFRKYEVGDLLIKAMGPTQLRQAVSDTALSSVLSAIFSIVNFVLMMSYDSKLAGAAFVFTLVTSLILLGLSRLQLRFERVQLKADAAVSSFILQILIGIQKIRLMGAEDRAISRWIHKFADQRQHTVRAARIGNAIQTLNAVLPVLASIMFFYMVGSDESRLSVGSFVAFNAAFGGFHGALLGLVQAVSNSLSAVPIYENMKPIMDAQPELDPERKPAPVLDGSIHLSNVSFRYDADGPLILNDVDLDIGAGQFAAFVGPSGSGKSTIFRLLLGFETPEQGTVGYDGLDLSRLDLKTVRRQIGVVLQRGAILPGSIFENIVGSAPLTQDEAWEAARMAGFDEDIEHMPMGMHTFLTEGGGTLSGGQRQRLMIARAVVRRPRILLMDEATSALDNRTQAIVSESLAHLNATRVVIAHRLSTVVNADRIFVVVGGRIVQSGTYEELMEIEGPFRDLARRQIA